MVYIYKRNFSSSKANGVLVIISNLVRAFQEKGIMVSCIESLNGINGKDIILPYGPLESYDVIKKGGNLSYSFLVDAISLGYKNKLIQYIKVFFIFKKDFFYSIYGYLRYSFVERKIIKKFNNIILVSNTDIQYLKKRNSRPNYILLANGANLPLNVCPKIVSDKIRLGILSTWRSFQSSEENGWFITRYFRRYYRTHNDTELVLAGRGRYLNSYKDEKGVVIMGEIAELNDFFSNIDLFLSVTPKGCGILNRLLDAFSYGQVVVGCYNAFSGFRDLKGGYLSFNNYQEFCSVIDYCKTHNLQDQAMNAYKYVEINHNWEKNYSEFVSQYFT